MNNLFRTANRYQKIFIDSLGHHRINRHKPASTRGVKDRAVLIPKANLGAGT
ncbi:hypothetical protein [Polynucleobacter sp. JS-JIR-II-b4]|uniref:hypothetical protein n=1 Tax=Polynucleobacter sp. JS-JIR-II-b4 TaxID=1758390 RepID=UPI001BFCF7CC|nr:hypothetical protein [Polynucleobacter sp. JS-JIR-II-b4]QWE02918.1 hypothetical protein ICV90_02155 [Polynucleobacter sp. JS-JIR-II-b4]